MTTTIEDCARFILKEFFLPNLDIKIYDIRDFYYPSRKTYEFFCYDRELDKRVWICLIDCENETIYHSYGQLNIGIEKSEYHSDYATPNITNTKTSNLVLTVNCRNWFYYLDGYGCENKIGHVEVVNFKNWKECKEYLDTL